MDQLVLAADELGKMEMMLESSVSRIIQGMKTILGNDIDQLESNLNVNQSKKLVNDRIH